MSPSKYPIPAAQNTVELEIKRSRFICRVQHTPSAESAKTFIAEIKQQFPEASHNCWAYQAGPPGDSRLIGCSDDGEPHGTAAKPMLNILLHAKIGELTAVVTRYYGGVKLGTGGLSRAYADAVKLALESLRVTEKVCYQQFFLDTGYSHWPQVEILLNQYQAENINAQYSDRVTVTFELDAQSLKPFEQKFINLTSGLGKLIELEKEKNSGAQH